MALVEHWKHAVTMTLKHEGWHTDDPVDPGGETFMGISRVHWPDWEGWVFVDSVLNDDIKRKIVTESVFKFYRTNFWNPIHGERLAKVSPQLAYQIFDTAVNPGVYPAGIMVQESLNLLNINQKLYPDIEIDGSIGSITVATIEKLLASKPSFEENLTLLRTVINLRRGNYYVARMVGNPAKEKYRGWFNRLQ